MKFGYHHASFRGGDGPAGQDLIERARDLEDLGYEWFSLMDHLWQLAGHGRHDEPFVECYAGLSAVAAATDEMELSALVTCTHYRNPGYLAKLVASLDDISGGRAVLGIGAGWYEAEYDALGVEYPPDDVRVRQLRDAIRLCRTAWSEPSPVDYSGEFFDLDGLYLDPKPDSIPVLVGGGGEQLTLRVVAEYADRWNVPNTDPERYAKKLEVLREHCGRAGRDPDEIETTVTLRAVIRDTYEAAHDAFEDLLADSEAGPPSRAEFRGLVGAPDDVLDTVATYRNLGADAVQINPPQNDRETRERFAEDVVPSFE